MKNAKTILALGLIIAVLPYIGVPSAWYRPFVFLGGVVITLLALRSVAFALPEVRQPQLFDLSASSKTASPEHE